MENRIKLLKDFDLTFKDNLIELLQTIKEEARNYQEHRYGMFWMRYEQSSIIGKKDNESLQY
jgi:hypothetical protein